MIHLLMNLYYTSSLYYIALYMSPLVIIFILSHFYFWLFVRSTFSSSDSDIADFQQFVLILLIPTHSCHICHHHGRCRSWPLPPHLTLRRRFLSMSLVDWVMGDTAYDQLHRNQVGGQGKHNNQPRLRWRRLRWRRQHHQ